MVRAMGKKAEQPLSKEDITAIADVGGNSVKGQFFLTSAPLVKHEDLPSKIREFCGLNGAIGTSGKKAKKARECALTTLKEIADKIEELRDAGHTVHVRAIATGPFRDKSGDLLEAAPDFIKKIKKKTGLDVECIDGNEEAELCAEAITARYGNVSGTVLKMGGSTAEFILLNKGKPVDIRSFPLGTLEIKEQDNTEDYIQEWISKLPAKFRDAGPVFFMGGTPRALNKAYAACRKKEFPDGKIPDSGDPILISSQRYLGHCETTTGMRRNLLEQKNVDIADNDFAKAMGVNNEERIRLMEYATLLFSEFEDWNDNQDVAPVDVNMRHGAAIRMQEKIESLPALNAAA